MTDLREKAHIVGNLLSELDEGDMRTVIRVALSRFDTIARFFGPMDIRLAIMDNPSIFDGITEDEIRRTIECAQETDEWVRLREWSDPNGSSDAALVLEAARRGMHRAIKEAKRG